MITSYKHFHHCRNIFTIVHSTIICSSTAISKALKSPEALLVGGTLLFSRLLLYVTWDQLSLVSLKESVQVNFGIQLSLLVLTLSRTGCLSFGTVHPGCFFFRYASGRIFSFIFSAHQRLITKGHNYIAQLRSMHRAGLTQYG